MEYIEAPHRYYGSLVKVFLAGGISNCEDWQAAAVQMLRDEPAALFNPRRADFPIHDPSAARTQIFWEFDALRQADIVLFWFAGGDSVQPIALYELGAHAANPDKRIAVGVHPQYLRALDVRLQLQLVRPGLRIHDNLGSLTNEVRYRIREITDH